MRNSCQLRNNRLGRCQAGVEPVWVEDYVVEQGLSFRLYGRWVVQARGLQGEWSFPTLGRDDTDMRSQSKFDSEHQPMYVAYTDGFGVDTIRSLLKVLKK